MKISELMSEYKAAKQTDNYAQHQSFIKQLLSSNDLEVVDFHFDLLKDTENIELYRRLRSSFKKRNEVAESYLVARIADECDSQLRGDALQLLGGLRSVHAAPLARNFITADDSSHRCIGCFVLGWVGIEKDIDQLAKLLCSDQSSEVRSDAATALRQLWFRLRHTQPRCISHLRAALELEEDEGVLSRIILSIQTILSKKFGLRENIDEGKVTGNVARAKSQARKVLNSFKE